MKTINIQTFIIAIFFIAFNFVEKSNAVLIQNNQSELHNLSRSACTEFNNSANDIQKSEVYNKANEIKREFGQKIGWDFSNWQGNIMRIKTNQGGDYADVIIVSEMNNITITFKDVKSLGSGGVSRNNPAFDALRDLKEGEPVFFSGRLQQANDRGIFEYSFTERGSLCSPEFGFTISNIRANSSGERRKSDSELFMDGIKEGFEIVVWIFLAIVILIVISNVVKKK